MMNKKTIISAIMSCLFLLACTTKESPITEPEPEDVQPEITYELVRNYFIKNSVENENITELKIETQSQMDSIFGMAALMGPEGMPTEVDFENQFVITVLDTLTSMETEMKPVSLRKEGDNLVLTYEISRGGTQSFSTHSHLTLVVDKVHDGNLKFIQKTN